MGEYPGPPITSPPAAYQPELVEQVDPPRELPPVDDESVDADERAALRFTLLIGAIGALVLVAVALTLLS